jgi:hypothetical protein
VLGACIVATLAPATAQAQPVPPVDPPSTEVPAQLPGYPYLDRYEDFIPGGPTSAVSMPFRMTSHLDPGTTPQMLEVDLAQFGQFHSPHGFGFHETYELRRSLAGIVAEITGYDMNQPADRAMLTAELRDLDTSLDDMSCAYYECWAALGQVFDAFHDSNCAPGQRCLLAQPRFTKVVVVGSLAVTLGLGLTVAGVSGVTAASAAFGAVLLVGLVNYIWEYYDWNRDLRAGEASNRDRQFANNAIHAQLVGLINGLQQIVQQQTIDGQTRDQAIELLRARINGLEDNVDIYHTADEIHADIVR